MGLGINAGYDPLFTVWDSSEIQAKNGDAVSHIVLYNSNNSA